MEDIPMNNIKPKERSERVSYKTIINNLNTNLTPHEL